MLTKQEVDNPIQGINELLKRHLQIFTESTVG